MTHASHVRAISSPDNALFKQLRQAQQRPSMLLQHGKAWLEGEHLCQTFLLHGGTPQAWLGHTDFWNNPPPWAQQACARLPLEPVLYSLQPTLWKRLSTLPSAAPTGMLIELPPKGMLQPHRPTVVLDRLQDPGNVGSILRTAAAMGFQQVLALEGTVALWSPKVLRAGMGAHFVLRCVERLAVSELPRLAIPLLATTPHAAQPLHHTTLPWPCAWLFGQEGQGLSQECLALTHQHITIAQSSQVESLNAAAAAAICLHASASQQPSLLQSIHPQPC